MLDLAANLALAPDVTPGWNPTGSVAKPTQLQLSILKLIENIAPFPPVCSSERLWSHIMGRLIVFTHVIESPDEPEEPSKKLKNVVGFPQLLFGVLLEAFKKCDQPNAILQHIEAFLRALRGILSWRHNTHCRCPSFPDAVARNYTSLVKALLPTFALPPSLGSVGESTKELAQAEMVDMLWCLLQADSVDTDVVPIVPPEKALARETSLRLPNKINNDIAALELELLGAARALLRNLPSMEHTHRLRLLSIFHGVLILPQDLLACRSESWREALTALFEVSSMQDSIAITSVDLIVDAARNLLGEYAASEPPNDGGAQLGGARLLELLRHLSTLRSSSSSDRAAPRDGPCRHLVNLAPDLVNCIGMPRQRDGSLPRGIEASSVQEAIRTVLALIFTEGNE